MELYHGDDVLRYISFIFLFQMLVNCEMSINYYHPLACQKFYSFGVGVGGEKFDMTINNDKICSHGCKNYRHRAWDEHTWWKVRKFTKINGWKATNKIECTYFSLNKNMYLWKVLTPNEWMRVGHWKPNWWAWKYNATLIFSPIVSMPTIFSSYIHIGMPSQCLTYYVESTWLILKLR